METWQIILIVTLGLVILFILLGGFGYSQIKKYEKQYLFELKNLDEYEIARGQSILDTLEILEKNGYHKDQTTYDVINNGVNHMADLNMDERSKYKNMVDMFSYILSRIHYEDKHFGKYISEKDAQKYRNYHLESDKKYQKYNRAAMRYNVYLFSIFTKFFLFLRREKKVTAIVF